MFRNNLSSLCFFAFLIITGNKVFGQTNKNIVTDKKILSRGKAVFSSNCASCHSMEDEGIGPKLGGITSLLSEKKFKDFVQNPSKVIESGDRRSLSLSIKYKMVMPPFDFLSDEEITSIFSYIRQETRLHAYKPLKVDTENILVNNSAERLTAPVSKSGLKIELTDFVQLPASGEKAPKTRISNMRPHPSGDGTLFVSDQRGIIYRIEKGVANTYLDLRTLVENYVNEPGLGTGLGSFAFHPDFLNNGLIYITYTEAPRGKRADFEYADSVKVSLQWVVSEWKVSDTHKNIFEGTRRELLRINVPGVVHGTQDIEFIPDLKKGDKNYGMLYIGTGDGGSTIGKHPELCHNLHSLLGTIIRIDPLGKNSKNGQYGIPDDNPFAGSNDPEVWKEIYAYGFRNPHRMSWDAGNNHAMFSTDVGESNFEEVNLVVKGGDYGWNSREGTYGISPKDLKNVYPVKAGEEGKSINPFAQYDHLDGNAISGGYVYEGGIDALKGKYIFGDIVNGRIFYIDVHNGASDHTIHELKIMQNGAETDLKKMSDSKRVDLRIEYDQFTKNLYILTKSDGKIRRVTKAYVTKLQ